MAIDAARIAVLVGVAMRRSVSQRPRAFNGVERTLSTVARMRWRVRAVSAPGRMASFVLRSEAQNMVRAEQRRTVRSGRSMRLMGESEDGGAVEVDGHGEHHAELGDEAEEECGCEDRGRRERGA